MLVRIYFNTELVFELSIQFLDPESVITDKNPSKFDKTHLSENCDVTYQFLTSKHERFIFGIDVQFEEVFSIFFHKMAFTIFI